MQVGYKEQNPYKISISKITKEPFSSFNSRPVPSLPNHISWDEQSAPKPQIQVLIPNNQNAQPKRRRKIFEHDKEKSLSKSKKVKFDTSQDKNSYPQKMMRKVKSNTSFNTPSFSEELELEQRIKEVNRQLAEYRSSRAQLSLASTERHDPKQGNSRDLSKLEQKLSESTVMIRKQQQILNSKLPAFEHKIQANNNALNQISSMIQTKFQENSLKVSRMMDLVNKNESRLKIKEGELEKINSELIHKEYELMRNKEENKKRNLELIRIKRIEDLQNKNLELYQSLERQSFKGFQDLEQNSQAMVEGQVWEDEEEPGLSKFTYSQESTIKYQEPKLNSSRQDNNNTLGEILSPLALSEYQY